MKKILIVEDESLVGHHLKLILISAGYKVTGISESVGEALTSIDEQKPDLVLLDIHLKGALNGIDLARKLTEKNMAFVYLSANFQGALLEEAKSTMPFGFIIKPFREDDLLTTLDVAFYRYQNSLESSRQQEMELNQKLKEIRDHEGDRMQKLLRIADNLQAYIPFDYLNFILKTTNNTTVTSIGFLRIGFNEYQALGEQELMNVTGTDGNSLKNIYSSLPATNKAQYINSEELDLLCNQNPLSKIITDTYDFESALFFPVSQANSTLVRYEFYSRRGNTYGQQHVALLSRLLNALGSVLEGDRQNPDISNLISYPANEPVLPKERLRDFDGIVGQSRPMLTVLDHINTISPLDTSVLILGESGTGKERVAKSIHSLSGRANKPLVVVNCASLPANLIESELFGHERGAFTGALEKRTGKFEMADGGTIFLDEIGELPIDLQVKLLRVLQEQEIERLGGKGPIKINVRIIAATNRDLEKEMEEGRFRLDLYYRLFVFPIIIPSLRERIDDIPALSNHFISYYSKKYRKAINGISAGAMAQMLDYSWPGNVRELEHFIERTILLSKTPIIEQVLLPKYPGSKATEPEVEVGARMKTIDENERDYIITVLKSCNGRIRGASGAAAVMGLPPTTLHSKMKRLGIK
ncbi:regulatory protein, Fis family [Mucilaginibacter gossypiicola]|uniref:Regulatory protein, Fis family n=1 Tax=Mucilaginibacter gossypiicola TaxID=551995 RepID=A0A1H8BFA6_9SPHI|nr:sigma 54-interacting transcriptional regulator [Mucilaginibacter gossypiicola]SEM80814.1 regulatory protein, Fis family [Mucilaginibacter gossypiicola]